MPRGRDARRRAVAEAILHANVIAARGDASRSRLCRLYGAGGIWEERPVVSAPESAYPLPPCSPLVRDAFAAIANVVTCTFGDVGVGHVCDVVIRLAKRIDGERRATGLPAVAERRMLELLRPREHSARWHHARLVTALEALAVAVVAWRRGDESESYVADLQRDVIVAFVEAARAGVVSRRGAAEAEEAMAMFEAEMKKHENRTANRRPTEAQLAELDELAAELGRLRDADEEQSVALEAIEARARGETGSALVVLARARETVQRRRRRLGDRDALERATRSLSPDGRISQKK